MTEQIIASPWRDGTKASDKSADLFDRVVNQVLRDAPGSTQAIRNNGAGTFIADTVDTLQMETDHYEFLFAALDDSEVLDLVDKLAARVRLVGERAWQPPAA